MQLIDVVFQVSPSLEVLRYVQSAQQSGHLVLTVPWIVEYLSMMDIVTPQTEYFQTVLMFLMQIHRSVQVYFKPCANVPHANTDVSAYVLLDSSHVPPVSTQVSACVP